MTQKPKYRNAIRSRNMIQTAFLALLDKKEFCKITVTDVVNRADINRSTFYAHYSNLRCVAEDILDGIVERNRNQFEQIKYRDILSDPMPYLKTICTIFEESACFCRKIGYKPDGYIPLEKCRVMMTNDILCDKDIPSEIRNEPIFETSVHFFIGGIMSAFQQWIEGKMSWSSTELLEEIAGLLQKYSASMMSAKN